MAVVFCLCKVIDLLLQLELRVLSLELEQKMLVNLTHLCLFVLQHSANKSVGARGS